MIKSIISDTFDHVSYVYLLEVFLMLIFTVTNTDEIPKNYCFQQRSRLQPYIKSLDRDICNGQLKLDTFLSACFKSQSQSRPSIKFIIAI